MSHPLHSLSPLRLLAAKVWQLDLLRDEDAFVFPVERLPVSSLACRFVATRLRLANGESVVGLIGNFSIDQPSHNEHFLTLQVFGPSGKSFGLARYHDIGRDTHGPEALASFLGLSLTDVFPIQYDLREIASGPDSLLHGTISATPTVALSRAELIALAVP
jgi:hypothetical protein